MKQYLSYLINGILAVAVIVLYVLHFNSKSCDDKKSSSPKRNSKKIETVGELPIAYINIDTLLLNYSFAKEANARLLSKSERAQSQLDKQMVQWQKEAADFQRKYQSNAFLTRERAEQENARLMKKRQDLENLNAKLSQELLEEQKRMNQQLKDSIYGVLKEFNKDKKYQLILSNTMNDNVLSSEPAYNITWDVLEELNNRAKAGK
jgi:outer membrane protein